MNRCTLCGRKVAVPLFSRGRPFGPTCYRKVSAKPVRSRAARVETVQREVDPNQRDLFAEVPNA